MSAVCKLTPRPPALVDRRNANIGEFGRLNAAMSMDRWTRLVLPSSRANWYPRRVRKSLSMSSIDVNCENSTTRWPWSFSRVKIRSSTASLPEASTSSSTGTPSSGTSVPAKRYGWLQHLRNCINSDWSFLNSPAFSFLVLTAPALLVAPSSAPSLAPSVPAPPPEAFFNSAASIDVNAPLSRINSRRYQKVCAGASGHMILVSVFSGSETSTSPLTRRSTNGFMR